jgi:MFS transporter, NNP family, nitrate/nitrite transporter
MSDVRQAQRSTDPRKINTLLAGIVAILLGIVSLQIWLLTATLNTALGGDQSIVWPAFYASLFLFLGAIGLLRFLPDPMRRVITVPVVESFPNASLAWRTLIISSVSLALAFAVWFMWSAIVIKLKDAGFHLTNEQNFWLTATPVILGSILRIPYGLLVSRFGSRRSYATVTLLLLVPCIGTGIVLQNPQSPYWQLLLWASLTGIAGANFATSMGAVTLWFPKSKQGTALGINGLGNLGVTICQFTIPVVIGSALWSGFGMPSIASSFYIQNAAFIWIPFILLCSAAIWFGTKDFKQAPQSVASQLKVCRDKHCWIVSYLYFLTFGAFVAMGASLPLIIREVFAKAPGGAPNPLVYAPFALLIATLTRPLGGWAADRFEAGRMSGIAIAVMSIGGFSLSQFLSPTQFLGFFITVMIICAAAGFGNGAVFKIIPSIKPKEAGPMIGVVSCIGALGGFFPPLLLGWCISHFGSPAWAYVMMALFAISCFVLNWSFYWRRTSPTHC